MRAVVVTGRVVVWWAGWRRSGLVRRPLLLLRLLRLLVCLVGLAVRAGRGCRRQGIRRRTRLLVVVLVGRGGSVLLLGWLLLVC